jgi:hypothetical protein
MPNARHPRQYPDGEGLQVSPDWKAKVRAKLEANRLAGRKPDSVASLARMIEADKSGLTKFLKSEASEKSKYAPPIIALLGIPQLTEDELDKIASKIRSLPLKKHEYAMEQLRLLVRMLDSD